MPQFTLGSPGSKLPNPIAVAQSLSSRIAAINEIAIAINCSLDLEQIVQILGKKCKWLIDFEHLSIYLLTKEGERLVSLFGPTLQLDQIKNVNGTPIQRALKSGQPQVAYKQSDMFFPNHATAMVMPLKQQEEQFGVIIFSTTRPSAYSAEDIRICYLLALQVSSAIVNAERFKEINHLYSVIAEEQRRSEDLLLNILPTAIAKELKETGKVKPKYYKSASVLFSDLEGFTKLSECFTPEDLVDELDICFSHFDEIVDKYGLEKLKTIGDGYMCVGGIPNPNNTHAIDAVLAAIEMQMFIQSRQREKQLRKQPYWNIRIGIHSGPVMAGVIGQKKFAYDVWGDTVNTASRMESSGIPGKINISQATFDLIKDFFAIEYRGKVGVKNKGHLDMFLVTGIRNDLSLDAGGALPNHAFVDLYLTTHAKVTNMEARKWAYRSA